MELINNCVNCIPDLREDVENRWSADEGRAQWAVVYRPGSAPEKEGGIQ